MGKVGVAKSTAESAAPAKQAPVRNGAAPAAGSGGAGPASVADLQRLIGNRAVLRLIDDAAQAGEAPVVGVEGGALPESLGARIDSLRGGGRPVDAKVSERVGSTLGTDLSGVRVHTHDEADSISRSLMAEAFTVGRDIFFAKGSYRPGSATGDRLLAHELTHVAQQAGDPLRRSAREMTVGRADDPLEAHADRMADQALSGVRPEPLDEDAGGPRGGGLQRAVIRRSVGYEFETNMKVEKAKTGLGSILQGYRPMRKMERIEVYPEGFRMEADENTTLGSTVEFVIDPPVAETDADGLEAILQRLDNVAHSLNQAQQGVPVALDTLTGNPAHSDVRATSMGPLTANPQVTGGIGLDKILTMMSEIGGGSANAPVGHRGAASELETMAPQMPGQAAVRGASALGSAGFKALVAFTSSYIKFGAKQTATYPPLNYSKLLSNSVLLRTDLGSMFLKLDPEEREEYEKFPERFVQVVMDAAEAPNPSPDLPVIERGVRVSYKQGSKGYNKLVDNAATRLSRKDWLTGITQGVDQLSSHHVPALKSELEGLGALGPTTDRVGGEGAPNAPLGNKDRGSGIVMEFRNMRKNVPWVKWHSLASEVFDYIVDLNQRP